MRNQKNQNDRNHIRRQLACVLAVTIAAYATPFSAIAQSSSATAAVGSADMRAKPAAGASMKMHESMEGMQKKMAATKMTGNPDIDFAAMMIVHHQGAIDMAQAEIDAGKDPEMIKAAKDIIAAQKKEIAQFEVWLKKPRIR